MIYSFITNKDLDVGMKQYFLDQLLTGVPHVIRTAEGAAFSLIKAKLNSRYNLTKLFPEIREWNASKPYSVGQYSCKDDTIYKATLSSTGESPETVSSAFWTEDDPRDKLLIIHCVNITIFYCAKSGNLRKLSDDMIRDYNMAITWLEDVKDGTENPDFPLLEIGGMELRSGSNPRIDHFY